MRLAAFILLRLAASTPIAAHRIYKDCGFICKNTRTFKRWEASFSNRSLTLAVCMDFFAICSCEKMHLVAAICLRLPPLSSLPLPSWHLFKQSSIWMAFRLHLIRTCGSPQSRSAATPHAATPQSEATHAAVFSVVRLTQAFGPKHRENTPAELARNMGVVQEFIAVNVARRA